jgi:hypothetical protein
MSPEPPPEAAKPEYITEALRRSGALVNGRVRAVTVENARPTRITDYAITDYAITVTVRLR